MSCILEEKKLHFYDIIGSQIHSLEEILDYLPNEIEEILFYFIPDRLASRSVAQSLISDEHLMVRGEWPIQEPFTIPPLSRF